MMINQSLARQKDASISTNPNPTKYRTKNTNEQTGLVMSRDSQAAISFVGAVQHSHIPVEDGASENVFESVLISNDVTARATQRKTFELIIEEIENTVNQIDGEMSDITETLMGGDFDPIHDVVKNLTAEIENISLMHSEVNADNTLATTGLSEFSEIYGQYEVSTKRDAEIVATVSLLTELQQWFHDFKSIESVLRDDLLKFPRSRLSAARQKLFSLERQATELYILPKLNAEMDLLRLFIKNAFSARWDQMVLICTSKNSSSLSVSEDSEALGVVISNLKAFDVLESKVSTLSKSLGEVFIQPTLKGQHSLSINSALLLAQEHTTKSPDSIFKYLTTLVTYIASHLPQSILDLLVPLILPLLTANIVTNVLPSHIPGSIHDLPAFDDLLNIVTHFDTLLVNLGWASATPLSRWVSDSPNVWFASRQAAFLSQTRAMVIRECTNTENVVIASEIDILNDVHNINEDSIGKKLPEEDDHPIVPVETTYDEEDEPDGWGFDAADEETEDTYQDNEDTEPDAWNWDDEEDDNKLETDSIGSFPYSVSTIPAGLMEIIALLLNEEKELQAPSYSEYSSLREARSYSSMIPTFFAIWRAIIQLSRPNLPHGQRMKWSNDALYLSRRLIPFSLDSNISAEMLRLNQCGDAWFKQELTQVAGSLTMLLATTDGFVNSAHPEQSSKCTQAIEVVKLKLSSLAKEYRDVLPPQKYRIAIGELLSSALLYMNTSLTLLEDISADESTSLINLYTSLFTLETLFTPMKPEQFTPEWLRSQYIRELLEWRMVDIMENWREGLLQGVFTQEEMAGWLRKLFQESDTRARNIAELLRG